jgi:hypothetical protein
MKWSRLAAWEGQPQQLLRLGMKLLLLLLLLPICMGWVHGCPGSRWRLCQHSWQQQQHRAPRQQEKHAHGSSSSRMAVRLHGAARVVGGVGQQRS